MKGLDASFSRVTPEVLAGWEVFVANAWTGLITPEPFLANLNQAMLAGLVPAIYTVVVLDGRMAVDKARLALNSHEHPQLWSALSFVAIDVEVDGTRSEAVREAVDYVRELGQRPVIYTGRWFWLPWLSHHDLDFSDIPCWLADYDYEPILDTPGLRRLGPVMGKQYGGTTVLGNVEVDLNVFDAQFVHNGEGDMGMTEEQLRRLAKVEDDIEAAKALIVANGIEVDGRVLTGEEAWQYAVAGGYSLLKAMREQVDEDAIVEAAIAEIRERLGG